MSLRYGLEPCCIIDMEAAVIDKNLCDWEDLKMKYKMPTLKNDIITCTTPSEHGGTTWTTADINALIKRIETTEELFNPNRPKVVTDNQQNALYFSRSTIPFVRGSETENWLSERTFWAHIGMYAYKADVLQKISKLKQGVLEKAESLEQLRWLENGFKIKTAVTEHQSIGIDTPEDLTQALQLLKNKLVF